MSGAKRILEDDQPVELAKVAGFSLGAVQFRPALREVEHDGVVQRVEPRVMQVLVALAEARGEVLSREELQTRCWNGVNVGDDALNRVIMKIRRLSEIDGEQSFRVETVPRVGYRLKIAPLNVEVGREIPGDLADAAAAAADVIKRLSSILRSGVAIKIAGAAVVGLIALAGLAILFLSSSDGWKLSREAGEHSLGSDNQSMPDPAGKPVRIAVIPFTSLSPDPNDQYFADGLCEELLDWLANVEGLKVPGRTASFYFRGKGGDFKEIGERLGVDYVLEGSVQKTETSLRIAAQLVDTRTGYHLWSKVFTRKRADIFALQDEIARAIVTELLGAIPARDAINPGDVGNVNALSQELYLEGRAKWASREGSEALQKFLEAVAADPRHAFAQAYVAVIAAHFVANGSLPPGLDNPDTAIAEALDAAVRLKPNSAEVLFAKAWVAESTTGRPGDRITDQTIIDDYMAAVRANPRHVEALHALTRAAQSPQNKIALYERILEIDPAFGPARGNLIQATLALGDRTRTGELIRQGLVAAPDQRQSMAARAKVLGDLALFGEAAFGDLNTLGRDRFLTWIAASLLADLGASVEARFLYEEASKGANLGWGPYLRVSASVIGGDVDTELTDAQSFHDSGASSHFSSWMLANTLIRTGEFARAYDTIVQVRPEIAHPTPDAYFPYWDEFADMDFVTAAHALDLAGRSEEALALWNTPLAELEAAPKTRWLDYLNLALIQSRVGDRAASINSFRSAYYMGFRYLSGYACSDCASDGFAAEHGLFASLVAIPENRILVDKIKEENAAALEKFNKQYGILDRVHKMMAAAPPSN